MGALPTAILAGCLQALKWLLWVVAALFLVLLVSQYLRNDMPGGGVPVLVAAGSFSLGGWMCGMAANWLLRQSRK